MRRLNRIRLPQPSVEHLLLLIIVIAALLLRLSGLNWDSGYGFHPDERSLYLRAGCMYDLLWEKPGYRQCLADHPQIEPGLPGIRTLLDFDRSPLNPHWFPLGSVLIYALVLCRSVIELFTDVGALDMRYVGRALSALADVGTVVLVYALGRRLYHRLYGSWVGLLAAALVALAVIHVQHSHFYRPETFSAFWVLAVFWAMLQVMERRRLRDSLLLGLFTGLAFAPKVSIAPILLPLALCYYFRITDSGSRRLTRVPRQVWEQTFLHALAAGAVSIAVFSLATPYGMLYLANFLAEQAAQTNMANHAGLWPFTIQYVGTPAFFYQFKQTAVWGLGPPLGLAAWASLAFTAFFVWRGSFARRGDILILAWVIPSILLLESFEVRFQRYYFALIPFMVLLGSRMLLWAPFYLQGLGERIRRPGRPTTTAGRTSVASAVSLGSNLWAFLRNDPRGRRYMLAAAWAPVGVVLGATIIYSLAFQSIYLNPHPAVAASHWINGQVSPGTSIVSDNHWDEYIPELYAYDVWQFPAYEPDGVSKMAELGGRLANAEYLVFYSQRPYVSVASDPERFPLSSEYYRQLFGGELGYRIERGFSSHPSLPGLTIRDDPFGRTGLPVPGRWASSSDIPPSSSPPGITLNWGYADDNVVGYDHPTVLVFRNTERLPAETLVSRLVLSSAAPPEALKFSAEDLERQQAGGTWSEIFDRDSFANQAPVLAWLLVIEFIHLLSLPLCLFLFRPLADRGLALARIAGLLVVAYVIWITVSLDWMDFSRSTILLGMTVVAGLSGLVLAWQWRQMWEFVRQRWQVLALAEAIFLVAFLAFLVVRALNPDLWHPFRGGEKPMELAYFNAVIRSTLLPPYDPWFAGGYLNYYYWGYFILAVPTRLAGIIPTTAFNLAVPLLFALTVTGAFSVVYNLAEGFRRAMRPARTPFAGPPDVEADADYAGDFANNPVQEFNRAERAFRSPITAGLTGALFVAVIGNLDGIVQLAQNVWGRLAGAGALSFDFWRSSRMLPNAESVEANPFAVWLWGTAGAPTEVSWHITEFPFFTFLFADLHAHMMAIPFTILVIGLSLNLAAGFRRLGWLWDGVALAALALALGSLWLINSWDYPSFLLLATAMAIIAAYGAWPSLKAQATGGLALAMLLAVLSLAAFLPFHQAVETFGTGIEVTRWQTPLVNFLGIHGLFLVIIGVFLLWQARRPLYVVLGDRRNFRYLNMGAETYAYHRSYRKWLRGFCWAAVGVTALFAAAGYFTAAAMLVFLALTCLVAWDALISQERGRVYGLFPLVLTALALGLVIGVDLVRIEDDIGRMNTLFKYYLEAWTLLALASAFFLWRTWYDNGFRPAPFDTVRLAWFGVVVALILFSLVYTFLGTQARLADRFNPLPPTLDGTAYMEPAVHWEREQPLELKWDREAIAWLQDNVAGSPVILEAHTEQYRWGGRMANYTGLPTVLGWPWHQIQQRGPYSTEVHARAADIERIYTTGDIAQARALLDGYGVRYVVVGDLERIFYPGEGLGKFDIMVQLGAAALVFDNGHTAIYRIGP